LAYWICRACAPARPARILADCGAYVTCIGTSPGVDTDEPCWRLTICEGLSESVSQPAFADEQSQATRGLGNVRARGRYAAGEQYDETSRLPAEKILHAGKP
jgi:hypothetical protein